MPFPPIEPGPGPWIFERVQPQPGEDLVAVGADLDPGTVLAAYRRGLFPMGLGPAGQGPLGWWSPDPRGVLLPGELILHRSLRKVLPRFEIRVDTAFGEVVRACADPTRPGRWITADVMAAYTRLFELGWAHSVEAWQDDRLAGGLYGLSIGGLFAGESMFHRARDASKVALVGLVERALGDDPRRILDVQWATPHLVRLGVRACSRSEYLTRLAVALTAPQLEFG